MSLPATTYSSRTDSRSLYADPIRLGFVPLNDSAPIIMARELGLFEKHGLNVKLHREAGWATIRDKIVYGDLDAAHALGTMPVSISLGLQSIPCECLTGMVLNLNGNAITLSQSLWEHGVRDGRSLRNEALKVKGSKALTFGVVAPLSSHNFLLRAWLAGIGLHPDRDVRIVTVPPPQMCLNLKAGNLDGYCVGEPWNSVAIQNGIGWCAGTSSQLAPLHPEKVLLVRKTFASERASDHIRLIAALIEACAWCDEPANHPQLVRTLSRTEYLNLHESSLLAAFAPLFKFGNGRIESLPDFTVFHRYEANEPSMEKAAWIVNNLLHTGVLADPSVVNPSAARQLFRPDIYHEAIRLLTSQATTTEYALA